MHWLQATNFNNLILIKYNSFFKQASEEKNVINVHEAMYKTLQ